MNGANSERIGKGMELLKVGLLPFVSNRFIDHYKEHGNTQLILPELKKILADEYLDPGRPFRGMDAAALLKVMWSSWNDVFRATLGHPERSLVSELRAVRNNWAHQKPFSDENAYRALDSVHRLLSAVSSPYAERAERLKMEQLRILASEQGGKVEAPVPVEAAVSAPVNDDSTDGSSESATSDSNGKPEPAPVSGTFSMTNLIKSLQDFDALREGDTVTEDTVDRVEPVYSDGSIFQQINPKIAQALQEQGINTLYEHQSEAISAALAGSNVVLEAPTASGKTLALRHPYDRAVIEG